MTGDAAHAKSWANQLAEDHGLEVRRWFGGWSLRHGPEQIAIVIDTVYLKANPALRDELDATGLSRPFRYHRSDGREIEVHAYRAVPEPVLNDDDALDRLFQRVMDDARTALVDTRMSNRGNGVAI